jgi:hypothetical protein
MKGHRLGRLSGPRVNAGHAQPSEGEGERVDWEEVEFQDAEEDGGDQEEAPPDVETLHFLHARERIAQASGMPRPEAIAALREAIEAGLILIIKNNRFINRTSVYSLPST